MISLGRGNVVLLVLAFVASGCKARPASEDRSGAGEKPAAKVRVQLNWVAEPEFGGLYAAREDGAFSRAGLEVEIDGGGAGTPVVQLVAGGQADFGVAGADDVVTARARGVDIVAVFGTFQTSPQGIMVREARGLGSLAEIKTGTLALEPGLPFGMFLKKKYGFAGATIVPYDGGIAKFVVDPNHAQQCYVTSEPLAARKKGIATHVFLASESGFDPYANIVITRGALAKEHPEKLRAFVAAVAEGWRDYLANPAPANAVMGKANTSMDAETFAEVANAQKPLIENADTAKDGLGTMREARWATLASQLVDLSVIEKAPAAASCFVSPAPAPPMPAPSSK